MKPVIIGGGLAGLSVALALAPRPVTVIVPGTLGSDCSSDWAQGGIAAALGDDDTAALHALDTMNAGGGLCDSAIVDLVTNDGPAVIERLIARHTLFDRDEAGKIKLGLEAAHGRRRIVHAKGDGSGHAVMQAMIKAARAAPSIEIIEDTRATDLRVENGGIAGVYVEKKGEHSLIVTSQIVLATGGAGALWQHTTNPLTSWGSGIALAAKAGALLADLEFMQFHPTAIEADIDPMPLASEALRGEGAILIDENGERFMADYPQKELEARDIVARAIWRHRQAGHKTFLDTRKALGSSFAKRFPRIHALCFAAGIDPVTQAIPVTPAAHYHMGGIAVDARGRTSIEGLWACGEVAATGLHGANRLASNSLLEAAAMGQRVADDVGASMTRVISAALSIDIKTELDTQSLLSRVRPLMSAHLGVLRDDAGLAQAITQLSPYAAHSAPALVGLLIAVFALNRRESRGAHERTDYAATSPNGARQFLTLTDAMRQIESFTEPSRIRA